MDYFSLPMFPKGSKPAHSSGNLIRSSDVMDRQRQARADSLKVANLLSPIHSTAGTQQGLGRNRKDGSEFNEQFINPVQQLLSQQEQATNFSTQKTSSNFFSITQYILQSYFEVDVSLLSSLKLTDLVVDHNYPDSLTLRKLNDSSSHNGRYQYFNTISRDPDISKCPIFALSVYFIIRWSHPNPSITIDNYDNIDLLDPFSISYDSSPLTFTPGTGNPSSTERVSRALSFEPPERLIEYVFPWLPVLRQNMLLYDRTNYKLYSFCELFQFIAKIIIQDLFYLKQHSLLLPNIVAFISKFIPDLLQQEEFKCCDGTGPDMIEEKMPNKDQANLKSSQSPEFYGESSFKDFIIQEVESRFLELSRKLTTENIRLSQQITQLKADLSSLTSLCNEILRLQKQSPPMKINEPSRIESAVIQANDPKGKTSRAKSSNHQEPNKTTTEIAEIIEEKKDNGLTGGILILDKSSLNANLLRTLLQSLSGESNTSTSPGEPSKTTMQGAPQRDHLPAMHVAVDSPHMSYSAGVPFIHPSIGKVAAPQNSVDGVGGIPKPATEPEAHTRLSRSGESSTVGDGPAAKRPRLEVRQTVPHDSARTVPTDRRPESELFTSGSQQSATLSPIASPCVQAISDNHTAGDNLVESAHSGEHRSVRSLDISSPSVAPLTGTAKAKLETVKKTIAAGPGDNSSSDKTNSVALASGGPLMKMNQYRTNDAPSEMAPIREPVRIPLTKYSPKGATVNISQQSQIGVGPVVTQSPEIVPSAVVLGGPVAKGVASQSVVSITSNDAPGPLKRRSSHSEISLVPDSTIPRPPSNPIRSKKRSMSGPAPTKVGPNDNIKYKLSRDNKTIWDLYTEWYIGFNGKLSIKKLIENYGWRRWKVSEDSHFFPTRRVIMDYIETEIDRGMKCGRFVSNDESRDDIRRVIVGDLEKFRIDNGLTLNSLSLYFRNLTKNNKEICIFEDFESWKIRQMSEDEKSKYCKRQYITASSVTSDEQNTSEQRLTSDRSGQSSFKPSDYPVELSELCPPTTIDPNTREPISSDARDNLGSAGSLVAGGSRGDTTQINILSNRIPLPPFSSPSITNVAPQSGGQPYISVRKQGSSLITDTRTAVDTTNNTDHGPRRVGASSETEVRITDDARTGGSATPESIGTPVLIST